MTSLARRKQKVNELRKAHFPFGFQTNKDSTSEYIQQYHQHPLTVPQSVADRSSHFTIGSDEPQMAKNSFQSEFKQQFKEHKAQPSAASKNNNDGKNIVLGFDRDQPKTNYQQDFVKGEGDRGKQVNQRVVNIDFGDSLTDFTTSYKKVFEGVQAPPTQKIDNNIRQTHLVFGYKQNNYQTSNSSAYGIKPIPTLQSSNRNLQKCSGVNLVLGTDSGNYHSQQKAQFAHKQSGYQKVDKNRVLDFKSAHFQLGFPASQQENVSEAKAHYNAKPLSKPEPETRKTNNIDLKFDDKNYHQSSYKDHFALKEAPKTETLNKQGRKDNVVIGFDKEAFTSEAKHQFGPKSTAVIKGKGAQATLQLGDGTVDYSTQYRHTFTDKNGQVERNIVGKEDINKLRVENFVKGFTNPDYKLHSMSYGQGRGETNKLTREAIDAMRTTNVVYGDDGFQGKTIHTSSYGWKKNNDF